MSENDYERGLALGRTVVRMRTEGIDFQEFMRGVNDAFAETHCRYCGRRIVHDNEDGWVDPEATGDDRIWRETCDAHDTFVADHEPVEA